MPKVSEEHKEQRRRQILTAAADCFVQKGFHACTMQDICKHANMSPGAVYGYFSSKEVIIQAMSEQERLNNQSRFQLMKQQGDVRRALEELIDVFFDDFLLPEKRHCVKLGVMLLSESINNVSLNKILQDNAKHIKGELLDLVETGKRTGQLSEKLHSRSFVQAMFALHQGLVSQIVQGEDIDVASYKTVMKQFIRSSYAIIVLSMGFVFLPGV